MSEPISPVQKKQEGTIDLPKPQDAWTRLATAVNGSRSANELLGKAGLKGWDVRPEPIFSLPASSECTVCAELVGAMHKKDCYLATDEDPDYDGKVSVDDTGVHTQIPGWWGLVRTNPATGEPEGIGATQREFRPVSIEKRAPMLVDFVKNAGAKFGPAGPLWNNTAAFVSVKLPELIKVGKAGELEMRVVLINSLLPGKPSQILLSPVRTSSGIVQHFGGAATLKLTFEDNMDTRMSEASQALQLATDYASWVGEVATALRAQKMAVGEFEKFCQDLWPVPSRTANQTVREVYHRRREACKLIFGGKLDLFAGCANNRWAAAQAVATVNEMMLSPRSQEDTEALRFRANDALFGRLANETRTAFAFLMAA